MKKIRTPGYSISLDTVEGKPINIEFISIKMLDRLIADLKVLRGWIVEDNKGDENGKAT